MTDIERDRGYNERAEISLCDLVKALFRKSWLIAAGAVLCAAAVLVYSLVAVVPQYEASVKLYVSNGNMDQAVVSSGDLAASRALVRSCVEILETGETMEALAQATGVDLSTEALLSRISGGAVNETEIMKVTVKADDPETALELAVEIPSVLAERIETYLPGVTVTVVEKGTLPTSACSSDPVRNAVVGFLLGAVVTAVGVGVWELTGKKRA